MKLRYKLCAAIALLLALTLRAYALEPSAEYVAPPNCSDPNDPKPVEPPETLTCPNPNEKPYECGSGWCCQNPPGVAEMRMPGAGKQAEYSKKLEQWNSREEVRDRCRTDCWTPKGVNRGAMTCTSKGLPQCSKQYLDDIWGAGGNAPIAVPAADRDVDVVVQTSYQYGTGDLISSKRICYVTKAQQAAGRRQQEAEYRRYRRKEQKRIAECERKPREEDAFHTEPDGMGCWKTVDQCGETRGTVCSGQ